MGGVWWVKLRCKCGSRHAAAQLQAVRAELPASHALIHVLHKELQCRQASKQARTLVEHAPEANTGSPRWVDPPFLGFTPPTTCVPYWMACEKDQGMRA